MPTKREIKSLDQSRSPLCISLYRHLNFDSPQALQINAIRIKNIIKDIRGVFTRYSQLKPEQLYGLLRPLRELHDRYDDLWQREIHSIAVFCDHNGLRYYLLPIELVDEQTNIGTKYLTEPLKRAVEGNRTFYVLSASHDGTQLFRGDEFGLKPVRLDALPHRNFRQELGIDEPPKSLQFHPATSVSQGIGRHHTFRQQFHGQYNPSDENKKLLIRYFRKINRAVYSHLRHKTVPLVFAGVEYLFPIYRSVNSYPHLHDKPLEGNYQHARTKLLHSKVLGVV